MEEFVEGREFTVLVLLSTEPEGEPLTVEPFELKFINGHSFRTFSINIGEEDGRENLPVTDRDLASRLKTIAIEAFKSIPDA